MDYKACCSINDEKPDFCRSYPNEYSEILPGCGYKFDYDTGNRTGSCNQCGVCCSVPRDKGIPTGCASWNGKPCVYLRFKGLDSADEARKLIALIRRATSIIMGDEVCDIEDLKTGKTEEGVIKNSEDISMSSAKHEIEKAAVLNSAFEVASKLPDGQLKKDVFSQLVKVAHLPDGEEKNASIAALGNLLWRSGKTVLKGAFGIGSKAIKHPIKALGIGLTGAGVAGSMGQGASRIQKAKMKARGTF